MCVCVVFVYVCVNDSICDTGYRDVSLPVLMMAVPVTEPNPLPVCQVEESHTTSRHLSLTLSVSVCSSLSPDRTHNPTVLATLHQAPFYGAFVSIPISCCQGSSWGPHRVKTVTHNTTTAYVINKTIQHQYITLILHTDNINYTILQRVRGG